MVERRGYTGYWLGNLKERGYLGDPGVDGRIILRILRIGIWGDGLDRAGSGQGRVAEICDSGYEL
jgi:hypothetical protein